MALAPSTIRRSLIAGVGMSVPDRRVTNAELAARLGVEEAWIAKRTGTHERPWAEPGERMSDHAARAATAALERAGVEPAELDLVLVATTTPDEFTPNAAPVIAGLVGARRAGTLDIGAACTGWLAGLAMARGQLAAGLARHVLVVGADFLSRFLDLDDRDTAVLFADGAGAAVVAATDDRHRDRDGGDEDGDATSGTGELGPVLLRSDPAGGDMIRLARDGMIQMDGRETFRAAVSCLSEVTEEVLEAGDLALEDVDLFVYHQANSRIIRAVGTRLGLDPDRVVDYVARYANASTATLPIALATAEAEGRLHPGDDVLLAAFGGGFTWGAATVRWPAPGSA